MHVNIYCVIIYEVVALAELVKRRAAGAAARRSK